MTRVKNHANQLAIRMGAALGGGLLAGVLFIFLREYLISADKESIWQTIQLILFQDIHESSKSLGIFYILGQLFVNALQLVIIPMVFTSIALAMCHITDTKKLGRISYKTIKGFIITSLFSLGFAGILGFIAHKMGLFRVDIGQMNVAVGSEAGNPLLVFLDAVPNNIVSAFTQNGKVLSIVFLAVVTGLIMHKLDDEIVIVKKILVEINKMVTVFLSFVITKFGPIAIFVLITRTFAIYGIEHLKPALAYVGIVTVGLILFLVVGYALFILLASRLNPIPFVKKIAKVALFGFSTSSSASTLPLNTQTTVEELGVNEEVASFILPLGMTINMNGTAIMQVIAAIFIASSAGYDITIGKIITIGLLALIASVGTPAAPGAGAIILFTVLTGMGYQNDAAVLAYSLILAINRPVEMLVTSLNVVGDAATALVVAKSENALDETTYYE